MIRIFKRTRYHRPSLIEEIAAAYYGIKPSRVTKAEKKLARQIALEAIAKHFFDVTKTQEQRAELIRNELNYVYEKRPKAPKSYRTFLSVMNTITEAELNELIKEGTVPREGVIKYYYRYYYRINKRLRATIERVLKLKPPKQKHRRPKQKQQYERILLEEAVAMIMTNKNRPEELTPREIELARLKIKRILAICYYKNTKRKDRKQCIEKSFRRVFEKYPQTERCLKTYENYVRELTAKELALLVQVYYLEQYMEKNGKKLSYTHKLKLKEAIRIAREGSH